MLLETLDGIGFLLLLPLLMIDLVVASNLMSMGMMMLPRLLVSLPFKLIFFVLIAGNAVPPTLLARPGGSFCPLQIVRRAWRAFGVLVPA